VGWSLAVAELMAYVDQFGVNDVRGIVLVDGFAVLDDTLVKIFPTFLRTMQMDRRGFTERFVRSMYKKAQAQSYLDGVVSASLKTPTSNAVALQVGVLGHPDWSVALAKLANTPTLFVYEDNLNKQAELLKEKLPSMHTELFAGAGHALFVDEPEKFNRRLESFLASTANEH
jgi:microsomal epoxide hydrolase